MIMKESSEFDDSDLDVELEHNDNMVTELRARIEKDVLEELQDELEQYKKTFAHDDIDGDIENEDTDDGPIATGRRNIERLDRILLKRTQREREVKLERANLQKKLCEDFESLDFNKIGVRAIKDNIKGFLNLCSSSKMKLQDCEDDDENVSHFFTTQPQASENNDTDTTFCDIETNEFNDEIDDRKSSEKKVNPKKNFIKRNIELAGDAAEVVALTDDEKMRLNSLLSDITEEKTEKGIEPFANVIDTKNVFSIDKDSRDVLTDIDNELKRLRCIEAPNSENEGRYSITPEAEDLETSSSNEFKIKEDALNSEANNFITYGIGEEVLQQLRFDFDQRKRLHDIDNELLRLNMGVEDGSITSEDIHELLESSRSFSSRMSTSFDWDEDILRSRTGSQSSNYPVISKFDIDQLLTNNRATSKTLASHRSLSNSLRNEDLQLPGNRLSNTPTLPNIH